MEEGCNTPFMNRLLYDYNVYINGVLQMAGLSTYTPGATGVGSLAITVPAGSSVLTGSPIVLEVVKTLDPDSTTDVQT